MSPRIPFIVAVVGALLVGGATTGSTRASWVDQENRAAQAVASGQMSRSGASVPTSLSITKGQTGTTQVTATNSSSAAAKNLVQRITPTVSVTTTPGPAGGVSATLTTTNAGGSCTGTAQGPVSPSAGNSFVFCVNVSATPATTAGAATVTATLTGQQMRNGTPQGWTGSQTVIIPVTLTTPTPATPVLTCTEVGNDVQVAWNEVPGETYRAETSPNGSSQWMAIGEMPAPYLVTDLSYSPTFLRVMARNAAGTPSGWSSNLRMTQSGNGKIRCG